MHTHTHTQLYTYTYAHTHTHTHTSWYRHSWDYNYKFSRFAIDSSSEITQWWAQTYAYTFMTSSSRVIWSLSETNLKITTSYFFFILIFLKNLFNLKQISLFFFTIFLFSFYFLFLFVSLYLFISLFFISFLYFQLFHFFFISLFSFFLNKLFFTHKHIHMYLEDISKMSSILEIVIVTIFIQSPIRRTLIFLSTSLLMHVVKDSVISTYTSFYFLT